MPSSAFSPRPRTPRTVASIIAGVNTFAETFPDARITAKALESGPPVGDPIQIKLYGRDMGTLYNLRDQIVAEVSAVSGTSDIRDDWGAWAKQVSIDPDPVRASRLGLTTQDHRRGTGPPNSTGPRATTYHEGDKAIPVLLRSRADYRDHPRAP